MAHHPERRRAVDGVAPTTNTDAAAPPVHDDAALEAAVAQVVRLGRGVGRRRRVSLLWWSCLLAMPCIATEIYVGALIIAPAQIDPPVGPEPAPSFGFFTICALLAMILMALWALVDRESRFWAAFDVPLRGCIWASLALPLFGVIFVVFALAEISRLGGAALTPLFPLIAVSAFRNPTNFRHAKWRMFLVASGVPLLPLLWTGVWDAPGNLLAVGLLLVASLCLLYAYCAATLAAEALVTMKFNRSALPLSPGEAETISHDFGATGLLRLPLREIAEADEVARAAPVLWLYTRSGLIGRRRNG